MWRLSDSGLLRGEVEDLQTACEAALSVATASLQTLEDMGGDVAGAQLRCGSGCRRLASAACIAPLVAPPRSLHCKQPCPWRVLLLPSACSVARQELELAGVPLDGSAWGGAPAHKLAPAQ